MGNITRGIYFPKYYFFHNTPPMIEIFVQSRFLWIIRENILYPWVYFSMACSTHDISWFTLQFRDVHSASFSIWNLFKQQPKIQY